MQNCQLKDSKNFEIFYGEIINHILTQNPSNEDTIHFLGALLYSTFDLLNLTNNEKKFYLETYNDLLKIKLKTPDLKLVK